MSLNTPNHYDEQFNQRINQIAKPGAGATPSTGSGSSGSGWGMRGAGGVIGVIAFIVIRVLLFSANSTSTYTAPTYHYTPPPMIVPAQRFDIRDVNQDPDKNVDDDKKAEDELNRILRRIRQEQGEVKDKE